MAARSFADRDNPGACPGMGWEVLTRAGRTGIRGERGAQGPARLEGHQGDKGNDAAEIVSWCVDDTAYRVIGFRSDGKPVKELNLRPMFERFLAEAGVALVEQVKAELRQNPW